MTIARAPIPTTQIPRCCVHHRSEVLDRLEYVFAVDAYRAVADMVEDGWPPERAAEECRRWMVGNLAAAIGVGAAIAAATLTVPLCPDCGSELNGHYCAHCQVMWR